MNLHEKSSRYDVMDCISTDVKCEHCGGQFELTLTDFYCLNMLRGLVYKCPYCKRKMYLKEIILEKLED